MIAIQYDFSFYYFFILFVSYTVVVSNLNYVISCSLFIFPHAGPDIKYLLGFLRTQLSTSVTIFLVFAPKVMQLFFNRLTVCLK